MYLVSSWTPKDNADHCINPSIFHQSMEEPCGEPFPYPGVVPRDPGKRGLKHSTSVYTEIRFPTIQGGRFINKNKTRL